jgi:hypothetical protein
LAKTKGRYGYLYLDPELDGKRKPKIWVAQKSVFSPAREKETGDALVRLSLFVLFAAAVAALYLVSLRP